MSAFRHPDDVPEIDGTGFVLRAHADDDLDAVVELASDPQMVRWTQVPSPYTRQDAEQFLDAVARGWVAGRAWCWAIDVDGRYAGNVELRLSGLGEAEVGFALHPAYRGRGLMAEAVRVVAAYGFDVGGVRSLVWTAGVGNWPSRRVAWACGFGFEGRLRQNWSTSRDRGDRWLATLLPDDPRSAQTPWLVPPVLRGAHVVLREHRDADLDRAVEACRDARTQHWLVGLPADYTPADAAVHFETCRERHAEGRWVTWAVADPTDDLLLGEVSLMSPRITTAAEAEVGYWTHPDARGRGVMSEAVGLAVRWAMSGASGLDLQRVQLRAADGNAASQRVAARCGFRRAGTKRRGETLRDGTVLDLLDFDLVPSDLLEQR